ncbi:unnamed protein product [Heterobilharzia americana]|nr:unnamed protein product [Heterobilharzia americana]
MSTPPANLLVMHRRQFNERISFMPLQSCPQGLSTSSLQPTTTSSFISTYPTDAVTLSRPQRIKSIRRKFFISESANIQEFLTDPDDQLIKAICERYKYDIEIYSRLPWCGFLQYIIILSACDICTLRRCARTLDSRLNWCLTAQLR